MPWTVEDVDKHKADLSDKQKEQWVKVANSALAACEAKDGADCDAHAIRIANAAVEEAAVPKSLRDRLRELLESAQALLTGGLDAELPAIEATEAAQVELVECVPIPREVEA